MLKSLAKHAMPLDLIEKLIWQKYPPMLKQELASLIL